VGVGIASPQSVVKEETVAKNEGYVHWAICYSDGCVAYDDDNRAHIYWSRADARKAKLDAELDVGEKLHIESFTFED